MAESASLRKWRVPSSRNVLGMSPIRSRRSASKFSTALVSGKPPTRAAATRSRLPFHRVTRSAETESTQ